MGRTAIVAAAFGQVSRAIRRTVLLAERLETGWARPIRVDDRQAMARRQIGRAVQDAIARNADAGEAERLTEALRERLDSLDALEDIGDRPAEQLIREICRDLGLDPVGKWNLPASEHPKGASPATIFRSTERPLRRSSPRAPPEDDCPPDT